jgi:hypothetical protein
MPKMTRKGNGSRKKILSKKPVLRHSKMKPTLTSSKYRCIRECMFYYINMALFFSVLCRA